jgi:hypothetical protein
MTKRHLALGLAAATAAGAVALTTVPSAGAAERRELVFCNWSDTGMVVETDTGAGTAMISTGCTSAFHPEIGHPVVLRLAGWDGVPRETTWYMPGQNMRLDITGPADALRYTPTYW